MIVNFADKAVLKTPQSKRCRDWSAPSNRAKRLDCGVFTAAFLNYANINQEQRQ